MTLHVAPSPFSAAATHWISLSAGGLRSFHRLIQRPLSLDSKAFIFNGLSVIIRNGASRLYPKLRSIRHSLAQAVRRTVPLRADHSQWPNHHGSVVVSAGTNVLFTPGASVSGTPRNHIYTALLARRPPACCYPWSLRKGAARPLYGVSSERATRDPLTKQRVDDEVAIAFAADDVVSHERGEGSLHGRGPAEPMTRADVGRQ